jgi:hypothetical protein
MTTTIVMTKNLLNDVGQKSILRNDEEQGRRIRRWSTSSQSQNTHFHTHFLNKTSCDDRFILIAKLLEHISQN